MEKKILHRSMQCYIWLNTSEGAVVSPSEKQWSQRHSSRKRALYRASLSGCWGMNEAPAHSCMLQDHSNGISRRQFCWAWAKFNSWELAQKTTTTTATRTKVLFLCVKQQRSQPGQLKKESSMLLSILKLQGYKAYNAKNLYLIKPEM